jgi:VanZ family protein
MLSPAKQAEHMESNVSRISRFWVASRDRLANFVVTANALVLMLASWTPGDDMIRTGILSGHAEHVIAYFLSGALMFAMLAARHAAWRTAAALVAYAGFLELGQTFVPGRHPAFDDLCFSAGGVVAGVIAGEVLRKLLVPFRGHPSRCDDATPISSPHTGPEGSPAAALQAGVSSFSARAIAERTW